MHWLFAKKWKDTNNFFFFEAFSTTFFFIKTLSKYFLIQKSTKRLGQPLFSKVVLSLSISWWKRSKFEQSLNALCNNVNSKLYLYDFGMKLPKFVKTQLDLYLITSHWKHCWNLNESTFTKFIDHCEGNWVEKSLS